MVKRTPHAGETVTLPKTLAEEARNLLSECSPLTELAYQKRVRELLHKWPRPGKADK